MKTAYQLQSWAQRGPRARSKLRATIVAEVAMANMQLALAKSTERISFGELLLRDALQPQKVFGILMRYP